MPNHHLAITLGPVYKTIKQARSTREIWAASYIFSIIMREVVYAAAAASVGKLLSPYKLSPEDHRLGEGIYPDRAFWKLDNGNDHEKLNDILTSAIKSINSKIKIPEADLSAYLRPYAVTLQAGEEKKDSIILRLNQLLDNLELREKISNTRIDLVSLLTDNIGQMYNDGHQNKDQSIFVKYDWNGEQKRLPSIIEIATRDLQIPESKSKKTYKELVTDPITNRLKELIKAGKRNDHNKAESDEQENVLQTLKKEYPDHFRFRHKYIAFVKADGDSMGTALTEIGNVEESITDFSTELSRFAGSASELIYHYGGIPIYAGGDDLLFALPLANTNEEYTERCGKNIFELISKLDEQFPATEIAALTGNKVTPSLSYGISFSYYKYPMDEILDTADQSLYKAKDFPGKNAVAFNVRKHSGQTYGACIPKGDAFKHWIAMVNEFMNFKDDAFLASFMYKLIHLELLLTDALMKESLKYLFKNQFNEKDHTTIYDKYLKAVRELLESIQKETEAVFAKAKTDEIKTAFLTGGFPEKEVEQLTVENVFTKTKYAAALYSTRQLYACLRFIQFINQKDNEQNH